jgi:hypothetical protein
MVRLWIGTALALGAMAAVSACGGSERPTSTSDELADAKSFSDHTLYYLGSSFHGLPLTFAGLGPGSGTQRRRAWDFIYGECTPSDGEQPSCAPPLDVQNWSICSRFPALYPGRTPKTSPVHGAETLPAGGGLDVYTGRTTVVIFGGDKSAVIRSLTRVSDDATPDTLPPPAPGSLQGKLPCQAQLLHRFSR